MNKLKLTAGKIAVLVILCFIVYSGIASSSGISAAVSDTSSDTASDDAKSIAEFFEPIYKEAREKAALQVYEQDVEVTSKVSSAGLFNISALKKYQEVTYEATVIYTVDLSGLQAKDINLDSLNRTVTLTIPKPQREIRLNYGNFKFSETTGGIPFLPKNPPEFSLKEVQSIETDAVDKIKEKVDSDDELQNKADETAINQVSSVFEPVVSQVDGGYSLKVQF